ncbi:GTP-binding protein [Rhizobium sp. LC145]|nr:GTP-binding protein [Rhizobiaceae bacterium LC148]
MPHTDRHSIFHAETHRITRLVFIGRDLPKDIISDGFAKCRAVRQAAE